MYWNNSTKVLAISDAMSVNWFVHLKCFLHVSNNQLLQRILNYVFLKCCGLIQEECQSIDEQIVLTKARALIRQYLPSKPHKWGFKIWACCGVSGVLYDFDFCQNQQ